MSEISILSWNVAGIRSCLKKEKLNFIIENNYDIVCFQETKAEESQVKLEKEYIELYPYRYWRSITNPEMRKGQSGTSIWTKTKPIKEIEPFEIDNEGRTVTLEFDNFIIVTVYTPNSQSLTSNRYSFRTEKWDIEFRNHINNLNKRKPIIICGDLNVIHKKKDIYEFDKKRNKYPGLYDKERSNFELLLGDKFIDCFREIDDSNDKYTYWNQKIPRMRKENKGWRLDYFIMNINNKNSILDCKIRADIHGSDHCPIELKLKKKLLK